MTTTEVWAKHAAILAKFPDGKFGRVNVSRQTDFIYESGNLVDVKDLGWSLWMEHQCDEFDIGGVEDARKLIADLQAAIDYCSTFKGALQ